MKIAPVLLSPIDNKCGVMKRLSHFKMALIEGETFLHFGTDKTTNEVRLWVSEDQKVLNLDDSATIDLLDIIRVQYGCGTNIFANMLESSDYQLLNRLSNQVVRILSWMTKNVLPQSFLHQLLPPNCFSIVYVDNDCLNTLDLQSKDPLTAMQWCAELKTIIYGTTHLHQVKTQREWLMKHFQEADTSQSGSLSCQEICELLIDMNLHKTDENIKVLFHFANANRIQQVELLIHLTRLIQFSHVKLI